MASSAEQYGSARFTASTGSTTSDTVSGGTGGTGGAGGSLAGGVRRLRLSRPAAAPYAARAPFGFALRGGKEHGTGFFVTHVDPGSEANNQGLKVGDQVVRVNGYRISDALHKEMLSLIASLNYLKLKVRNVGMIPVKDRCTDPLTWRLVAEPPSSPGAQRRSPPLHSAKGDKVRDVRLTLLVPSRSKLGCGICKGPDWKPGIFVQFTKENGIARDSGLRPGDQIMQCNGIDFREIQFSDAVNLMKQSRRLELWVRTGAGLELFPGESSGYNSSASSATGDQSPSSADHKRLSIVKEETFDLEDRLCQLDKGRYKTRPWEHRNFEWENSIKENESEYMDYSDVRNNTVRKSPFLNISPEREQSSMQNRTIINLSEKGTTIQNSYVVSTIDSDKILNGHRSATPVMINDKKTVVVDVHRSEEEYRSFGTENITNVTTCQVEETKTSLRKVSTSGSVVSLTSSTTSSLSNAISQEFQKRAERLKNTNFNVTQMEEMRKNKVLKDVDDEKKQKHDALMDEFKKAHRRMFANGTEDTKQLKLELECQVLKESTGGCEKSEKNAETLRSTGSTVFATPDRPFNAYNGTTTTPRVQSPANPVNGVSSPDPPKKTVKPPGQPPPPPPPMPNQDQNTKAEATDGIKPPAAYIKPKAPPPPAKKPLQNGNHRAEMLPDEPPATPTPDYDTSSLVKVTSKPKLAKAKSDAVEMESLESFKLTNPSSPTPRPPNTYFMKQPSGTLTMKKANPQVSVTIGEYPTNTFRKQPSKLEFLSNDSVDGKFRRDEPVGSRLQSELVQTLSRSNLKKKTENDLLTNGGSQSKSPERTFDSTLNEPNANFHKRYGHVMLPQPPSINIPKVPIGKSLSMLNGKSDGRVSITPSHLSNGKLELAKTESLPHGGILKNSTPMFINERNAALKMSAQQKSIKFGQTTTVIGDPEMALVVNH